MSLLYTCLLLQYYFVGAKVKRWGMWETTEGQGSNGGGARGAHS